MLDSSSELQVKEAVFITPSDTTPSHVLKLSAIDSQLFLRFTIEYLLIYRPARRASDQRAILAFVKDALARALVPYYPLAGRVRARADGSCLEVVCRGQGAVFIESTGQYSATDFERAPRYVTEWRNLLAFEVTDVVKGAPLLVMQLTWLSDGSVALGIGFSHCICDGVGSLEFLKYFSELAVASQYDATTELKPKSKLKPIPIPIPIWDRYLLDPPPCRVQTSHHPEFSRVTDHSNFLTQFNPDQLTPTTTTFPEWRINELKTLVASTSQLSVSALTSFEVVSAHIWRSWAQALNFPAQQTLKLLFSINIRNRVKPSLPKGYYGNAIVLGCALTTARQLTENGLTYATELIREAKNRVDDGFVREVVESVSLNRASEVPDSVGVLILSQWSKVGLENVEFGLGRPVQVSPVCTDKYCILLPVQDHSRSVKSMLAVPTEAVGRYEHLIRAQE